MGLLKRGDEFDQKSIFWQIIFPESSDVSLYSLESFASSTTLLSHTGALLFLRQPRSQLDLTGCCSIQISHQFSIIRNLLQSVLSSPYYSYYPSLQYFFYDCYHHSMQYKVFCYMFLSTRMSPPSQQGTFQNVFTWLYTWYPMTGT